MICCGKFSFLSNKQLFAGTLVLFGTWLGTIRITWGKSPERLFRYLRFSKRATVGVLTTNATRWNSGMKRVKCGWTQPLFHKVSNHWFTNTNTNNLFPPIPSDTVMFIYDKYDNKYYNTISCSCLLQKMIDLFTMSLWIRISCSHFLLGLL